MVSPLSGFSLLLENDNETLYNYLPPKGTERTVHSLLCPRISPVARTEPSQHPLLPSPHWPGAAALMVTFLWVQTHLWSSSVDTYLKSGWRKTKIDRHFPLWELGTFFLYDLTPHIPTSYFSCIFSIIHVKPITYRISSKKIILSKSPTYAEVPRPNNSSEPSNVSWSPRAYTDDAAEALLPCLLLNSPCCKISGSQVCYQTSSYITWKLVTRANSVVAS